MYRYAVCSPENKVINIIKWDGTSNWMPPKDHYVIKIDDISANIGDIYNKELNTFSIPITQGE